MSRLFAAAGAGAGAASSWLQVLFAIIVFIDEIKFVNGGVIIPDNVGRGIESIRHGGRGAAG